MERARLLADNIELDQRATALAGQIAEAETGVEQLAAEETALREGLAALEESLRALRDRSAGARRNSARKIEVELVKRQAELKFLDETSRKELGAPIAEVAGPEETVPDEMELAELEQKYEDIKARIEALGPVNPQALEEYQEAQQRYDFLNTQRQDLLDSIRDTEKAIHDIDVETRRRFVGRLRSDQRQLPGDVPGSVRRRHGRDAADRRSQRRRSRASRSWPRLRASGCRTCCCCRAARRR